MGEVASTQIGRYRILAELGRGAMGVVYRAEDPLLDRPVAIKTIIMSEDAEERAEYEARFHQEAKAAGGLNHPNIITVHDIGRDGAIAYMAMELLEGVDLRELMSRDRLPLRTALDIAAQVADGLAFAHERGVVHRDIKPANIMIVRERHAKIMDFGIASIRVSDVKTQAGVILGSPRYMSPEQVRGERADHRSDIYSLGVVIYELAAGQPPFSAAHVTQLMQLVATATPRPPTSVNAALPPVLDLIVAKALEKNPDARYQSAGELAADVRTCLAGLAGAPAAAGATATAGPTLDVSLGSTTRSETTATNIPASGAEVTKTLPLDADATKAVTAGIYTRATDPLLLSRRFDSTEALRRVAEMAAGGGVPPENGDAPFSRRVAGPLQRVWKASDRRSLAAALLTAAVAALLITFW